MTELPAHVQRMKVEGDELTEKVEKLTLFMMGNIYPELPLQKRTLLANQFKYMTQYLNVLAERIVLEMSELTETK